MVCPVVAEQIECNNINIVIISFVGLSSIVWMDLSTKASRKEGCSINPFNE